MECMTTTKKHSKLAGMVVMVTDDNLRGMVTKNGLVTFFNTHIKSEIHKYM